MQGRGFIMLRQPEQRLLSGYFHEDASGPQPHGWCWLFGLRQPELELYAHVVQGAAVKMLVRAGGEEAEGGKGFHCNYQPPSPEETALAVRRLWEGFAFVGLTEEWRLSICLLHLMFGGECHESEMRNAHPGPRHTGKPYDTAGLKGFRDVHDGALYEEAQRIFRENLRVYNASQAACEPCFRRAGLL